ncbi:MAG TPA: rhodanese-like domain-containing protein, partial [Flavobacteriales bacterium]|nr:rhodanese-like domain-containing protein [Flavobacteriales bacterium]
IKEVTDGILPPPAYFPQNVAMNKGTIPSLEKVKELGMRALTPDQLELVVEGEGALVLDTRVPQTFKDGFVPRSINIGLKGDFAPWVGAMIPDVKHPIVIVADEGSEDETVTRLARVGYDNVFGYLEGGINAWKKAGREADTLESISAQEFARRMKAEDLNVFDVRKQSEWEAEHLEHAKHASLQFLNDHLAEFNKTAPNYIHCAGGYRSMIASSVLKSRGYHNVIDVAGGFAEIKKTDLATTAFVCPSTLKS